MIIFLKRQTFLMLKIERFFFFIRQICLAIDCPSVFKEKIVAFRLILTDYK